MTIPRPNVVNVSLVVYGQADSPAILQELINIYDTDFSEHRFGFRAEKNAHQALQKAREYIGEGYSHVDYLDLAQFFKRVNHVYLMNELSRKITDKRALTLIHKILRADIQEKGQSTSGKQGLLQGGPLRPLLSDYFG